MKIVTHNVKFHPDDVFATAVLLLKYPEAEIIRTRDEGEISQADIVVDVGGVYDPKRNRFDHHQLGGAGERGNGIPYASFGLVWKELGAELCGSQEISERIDMTLVQPIDAGDCGKEIFSSLVPGIRPYSAVSVVGLFKPTWKETEDWDGSFKSAVDWAKGLLQRMIKIEQDMSEATTFIKQAYENSSDKRLVVVDTTTSFGREVVNGVLNNYPEPLYAVLFRRDHQSWQLLAINVDRTTYNLRKPLPESWRAKKGEALEQVTGVSGADFCHNSGFMCTTKTKEAAIALAHLALEAKNG